MKKLFLQLLILLFAFTCIPSYADTSNSSESGSSSGGGGGSGAGIAIIGAAAVIGLLIWAFSDKKDTPTLPPEVKDPIASQAPVAIEIEPSEAMKKLPPSPTGGVGAVKGMEF